jgi:F420-non-reducing hydrogenase small subunit
LTSCSGCTLTLLSLDIFPQFLERTEIAYFPTVSDKKEIDKVDIALVEGCVSEESQIDTLKYIRKNSTKVCALGTCAAFGGILGLSKRKKVYPISKYIDVDYIIPGCPPPVNLLGNALMNLVENKPITLPEKNMCFSCPLKGDMNSILSTPISRLYPSNSDFNSSNSKQECFLKRGILCLGPVTREGCDHLCIEKRIPCEGCLGPPSKDFTSNLINFLSLIPLSNQLKRYSGIFTRFSKPILKR